MAQKQYVYGSGEIYFAQFKPGTQTPGARRYLGNTPEFTVTAEQESLEHMDSDHGVKEEDQSITISTTRSGTIITDNIDFDNLAMFFLGTSSTLAVAAGTSTVDTIDAVEFGLYQLGITPSLPTGARKVTVTTVTNGAAGSPVPYTAGTDYLIDADRGTVQILDTGTIVKGTKVAITWTSAAHSRRQVIASNKTIEGEIWFKSYNATGPLVDYLMPWAKLTPNGDLALKGDDWQQIPFNVKILKKAPFETVYADGVAETA